MATLYTSVKPGEVITSDVMNYVLGQLNQIDVRVTKLETGGTPAGQGPLIAGFDPPNQVPAGQVLSLKGRNFAFPFSKNEVTIDDSRPITDFREDSTDSQLNFLVPTTIVPPTGGKIVTITVRNTLTNQTDSALYRIMPRVQAPGNDPVITDAVADDGSGKIHIGKALRITGRDFAATPAENIITFTVMNVVYPKQGQTLTIDTTKTTTEQIVVTVPDMAEVPAGTSFTPVILNVGVGAHVPAAKTIQVNR